MQRFSWNLKGLKNINNQAKVAFSRFQELCTKPKNKSDLFVLTYGHKSEQRVLCVRAELWLDTQDTDDDRNR